MNTAYSRLCTTAWVLTNSLIRDENGQDLIEYALVVGLIVLGATASMSSVASSVSTALSVVGSKMSSYTS